MSTRQLRIHGSLVDVGGLGVLLLGQSGIGKSECAMELVRRGHRLVADDVVLIEADEEGIPVGQSPELVRHYVELRGIGIINVPSLFGLDAVVDQARIELIVRLSSWGTAEVDRSGLETRTHALQGFEVPAVELPVAPGRNLATLVEIAARNHELRRSGVTGARTLDERVNESLRKGN